MSKIQRKKGTSLIEMLLALAILSLSLYPLAYIAKIAIPTQTNNEDEYIATLLAHHVIETIVAKRNKDATYLPSMSEPKPVVFTPEMKEELSEYFKYFAEYEGPIEESKDSQLYWALNKYKCSVDTYFLDENIFKIIVYISYMKDGRTMRVFFERLLPQNEAILPYDEVGF